MTQRSTQPPQHHEVRSNILHPAVDRIDVIGEESDAILFVHGHPFNRSMWHPQIDPVRQAEWRFIAPDLRGYGESPATSDRTTLDVFAADLVAILDHLEVERAVVCGLSMGGQIAMEFARQYPERLRALVLAATFAQVDTAEGRQKRLVTADRLVREGMDDYAVETLPKMLGARSLDTFPAVAAKVMTMMRTTDPRGAAAALRGRADRVGYEDTLRGLAVPALVIVGSEDAFTTRQDAETMQQLMPDAHLVWLDGVGHMPNLESPFAFNEALVRFLRSLAPTAART